MWLDVGWWQGRALAGAITVSPAQWPHGIAGSRARSTPPGCAWGSTPTPGNGCGGVGEGSYGHYQQDPDTFAAWGFDAVKVDFCGGAD